MLLTIALALLGLIGFVLAVIGLFAAVRETPIDHVCAVGGDAALPAVADAAFCRTMELLTQTALRPGHTVDVFVNGDETYPRLWADLRAARESIVLQLYYCNTGRMADELEAILTERARAGVTVFFLYDSFGTALPRAYFERLGRAGVRSAPFRTVGLATLYKAQHRAHSRVVVVDGRVAYTGGFGIDDKWYGNGRTRNQWRDSTARFTGPAVLQLQAAFCAAWAEATGNLLAGPVLFPPDAPPATTGGTADAGAAAAGASAGVLHAAPTVGSTPAERFFVLSIASARHTLWIANSYFVPDASVRNLLRRSARRGVDVRVLTTSRETDVKSTWYAGRARYEELLRDGVRIFEYQPAMMHAKTFVADHVWSTVGSMNADNRSMSFNDETNLLVHDRAVGARMAAIFEEDLRVSREIRLEEFRRRGWPDRVAELACHLVWRVL